MKYKSLILEVTRRCNLKCAHCMRGEPQNVDMSEEIINRIFEDIQGVDEILFTGGEPMLVHKTLRNILKVIEQKKIEIGHFKVVACDTSHIKAYDALNEFHERVSKEPLLDIVEYSTDKFHPEIDWERIKELGKIFDFVEDGTKPSRNFLPENSSSFEGVLIGCGRATDNQDVCNPMAVNGFEYDKEQDRISSDVVIDAFGYVHSSCDLSYELMDKYNFGNVLKTPLTEIIDSNIKDAEMLENIEIETAENRQKSFRQYWTSLSESKCGDWFGYALSQIYGRDMPGFSIFDSIKRHPRLENEKLLEDFVRLEGFRNVAPPLWLKEGEEQRYLSLVKLELINYLRVLTSMVFAQNPMLELIDCYYRDLPYSAGKRLHPFIEKLLDQSEMIEKMKKEKKQD